MIQSMDSLSRTDGITPMSTNSPIDATTSHGSSSNPFVDSGDSHDALDDALMHEIVKDDVLKHPMVPQGAVYNNNQPLRIISTGNANKHFDTIATLDHVRDLRHQYDLEMQSNMVTNGQFKATWLRGTAWRELEGFFQFDSIPKGARHVE